MNAPDLFLFDIPDDPLTGTITTAAAGPRRAPSFEPPPTTAPTFVALATTPHPPNRENLRTAVEALRTSQAAAVLILRSAVSVGAAAPWRRLPASVAVLTECPTAAGWVVTQRSTLGGASGVRAVDEPVWEWFTRCCDEGPVTLFESTAPPATEAPPELPENAESALQELTPARGASIPTWLHERLAGAARRFDSGSSAAPEAVALAAGLLQWHDYLDESHQQSQTIEGEGRNHDGDYWHAIMHRREPDYDNAKYWFRQVGQHPIFAPLATSADRILAAHHISADSSWKSKLARNEWDPNAFVDFCAESQRSTDSARSRAARHIQQTEMILLLEQTCADAKRAGCRFERSGQ